MAEEISLEKTCLGGKKKKNPEHGLRVLVKRSPRVPAYIRADRAERKSATNRYRE